MKKEDFKFEKIVEFDDNNDYWFTVRVRYKDILDEYYLEENMLGISEVVYSDRLNETAVKKQYPHTFTIQIIYDDLGLKDFLRELVSDVS